MNINLSISAPGASSVTVTVSPQPEQVQPLPSPEAKPSLEMLQRIATSALERAAATIAEEHAAQSIRN